MNPALYPGPGDLMPQYAGHPHDPRTPEDDSDDTTAESVIAVSEYMLHAFIAYRSGNHSKYDRILREAAKAINIMLGESK